MKTNPWISKLIQEEKLLKELGEGIKGVKTVTLDERCIICKGSRFLCGKTRCPILLRLYAQLKIKPIVESLTLRGSSPPDIFVGRIGYPYVYVGPLIPPIVGDTSSLGTPELWVGKSIEEIVNFRSQLVRGKYKVNVKDVEKGKIVELIKELALSKESVEAEAIFSKKPTGKLVLSSDVQPFGPSAPLKDLSLSSLKTEQKIEKAYSDTDLKASEAVFWLYNKGILISKIQRAFSVGLFGIKENRRFVPTRWSITAVDSIISQKLLEEVKTFPWINEYRVYENVALDNRWFILMIPSYWSYESMEAWYPKTLWNPTERIEIYSDWEGYEGRTTYASIGGCYYAARVSISEALVKEKRQATVVIFREIHPGYIMPVGVWNVREAVKNALAKPYKKFDSLKEALDYISSKLEVKMKDWIANSQLLKNILYQKKLENFLKFKI